MAKKYCWDRVSEPNTTPFLLMLVAENHWWRTGGLEREGVAGGTLGRQDISALNCYRIFAVPMCKAWCCVLLIGQNANVQMLLFDLPI